METEYLFKLLVLCKFSRLIFRFITNDVIINDFSNLSCIRVVWVVLPVRTLQELIDTSDTARALYSTDKFWTDFKEIAIYKINNNQELIKHRSVCDKVEIIIYRQSSNQKKINIKKSY